MQWTPAHCGISGNEQADEAAKSTTALPVTLLALDRAEKISILKDRLQADISNSWAARARTTRIGQIKSEFRKWPWAERTNRYEETLLSNFRLGNPPLNKYLHRARIIQSPNCFFCPNVAEDSEHFFLRCRFFNAQRSNLKAQLRKLNINSPTLAILLGGGGFSPQKNKKIIDLTCAFCRATNRFKSF